jgi:predicted ATPase
VAEVLGLQRSDQGSHLVTLTNFLQERRCLLILDNCEHVLDACAQLIDALLRSCPRVTVLATSRERLGISGEKTYRVPSLSALDPSNTANATALEQTDALRLFIERAAAVLPGFALTEKILLPAARICYRLDGIPLAIELAAARMSSLGIEEIAERLDDRFRLLTAGSRSALPRQRTLRASIDWSYSLLNHSERVLLQRLSVFAGGWTLAAAEAVCAGEGLESADVLEALSSLVEKSIVGFDRVSSTRHRYSMLETIRQYALEKLEESGDNTKNYDKHLNYFVDLAHQDGPRLKTDQIVGCLEKLVPELDNLRAALVWALGKATPAGAQQALSILIGLDYFWAIRGLYWETFPRILHAMDHLPEQGEAFIKLRATGLYTLAVLQTDFNIEVETVGYLKQCVALFRKINYPAGLAQALALKSYLVFRQQAFFPPDPALLRKEAQQDQEESYALAGTLANALGQISPDQQRVIAWVDCWNGAGEVFRPDAAKARALGLKVENYFHGLGDTIGEQYGVLIWLVASLALGESEKVLRVADHAIEMARQIQHKRYLSFFIEQKVGALFEMEKYAEAEIYALEGLGLQRQLGAVLGEVENYLHLGIACTYQRKYSQALNYLRDGLRVTAHRMGYKDPLNFLKTLLACAELAEKIGDHLIAARLLGFIECQLEILAINLGYQEQRRLTHSQVANQQALPKADQEAAWQQGLAMTQEQAAALVLEDWNLA